MNATKIDSLSKAVASLGAVEVAPGRYAWHTKRFPYTSGAWLTANRDWLLEASYDGVEIHEKFATLMPAWWSPDHRFAWRSREGFYYYHAERAKAVGLTQGQRITADLETGAEVPA